MGDEASGGHWRCGDGHRGGGHHRASPRLHRGRLLPRRHATLSLTGFTPAGVAAGSLAAAWQGCIGDVGAASLFASLQSMGATGCALAPVFGGGPVWPAAFSVAVTAVVVSATVRIFPTA